MPPVARAANASSGDVRDRLYHVDCTSRSLISKVTLATALTAVSKSNEVAMSLRYSICALMGLIVFVAAVPTPVQCQVKPPKQQGQPPRARDTVPTAREATLTVKAAIVMSDMTVRPLPTFALELVNGRDSTVRIPLRTALDGTVTQTLSPGPYTVHSIVPVVLNDSSYQWDVPITIGALGTKLELTNANASAIAVKKVAARQIAPEREIFEKVRRGVFRIEAGLGHGSGFLARIPGIETGLVVTDEPVLANEKT